MTADLSSVRIDLCAKLGRNVGVAADTPEFRAKKV
jgi:hypothetical protein